LEFEYDFGPVLWIIWFLHEKILIFTNKLMSVRWGRIFKDT
jgi:hypothetical protein